MSILSLFSISSYHHSLDGGSYMQGSTHRRSLREEGRWIIDHAIQAVKPDMAVENALQNKIFSGKVIIVAVGKAAWQMADTASRCLGPRVDSGIVITKYGHVKGQIKNIVCYEGGHPVPDENSFLGTQAALDLVKDLSAEDTVLFLLSGGGSALFEIPLVPIEELQDITQQMLASGADIVEINTMRKRLSKVKGGRFAQHCLPAKVFSVILSDILGDPLDMIASGPTCPDKSTCAEAQAVAQKYGLRLSDRAWELLHEETPEQLDNAEAVISGSVRQLCSAAADFCRELDYEPFILTDSLCCQAKEAGAFLASIVRCYQNSNISRAFIAGGETLVKLTGNGKGGRNQELALAAADGISGIDDVLIFSVGSDGTDGPTDAAGGMVDGHTASKLRDQGISIYQVLQENDSYHALQAVDGLVMTGPTGTNVNDVAVALIRR